MRNSRSQQHFFASSAAEVWRPAQPALEGETTGARFFLRIQLLDQEQESRLQLSDAHVFGEEIYIEQGAQFPGLVAENAPLAFQALVQRCSRERSHKGHLNLVQT